MIELIRSFSDIFWNIELDSEEIVIKIFYVRGLFVALLRDDRERHPGTRNAFTLSLQSFKGMIVTLDTVLELVRHCGENGVLLDLSRLGSDTNEEYFSRLRSVVGKPEFSAAGLLQIARRLFSLDTRRVATGSAVQSATHRKSFDKRTERYCKINGLNLTLKRDGDFSQVVLKLAECRAKAHFQVQMALQKVGINVPNLTDTIETINFSADESDMDDETYVPDSSEWTSGSDSDSASDSCRASASGEGTSPSSCEGAHYLVHVFQVPHF